ncbi:MAG: hypothetical protein HRF46_12180, partial [Acidobacteriota bacterium]
EDSATVTVIHPNIDVAPLSLASTQLPDTSTSQTLNIGNTGVAPLTWEILEENLTRITPAPPLPDASADPRKARDLVDPSEPLGPVGSPAPREAWNWPAAVLYDNGPLVTHPGGGFGGADASALQSDLGLSTYGFGHALSSGYRVADDITVPAGGWYIDTITFFAYQTGSGTTSTIDHINLRIWDGVPGAVGSTIVWGDTTTNRLVSTAWSNIYRVLDTNLLGTTRPVMANVAAVGVFLPAGTYWLDWQTGGTLASGPWVPPVTLLGQTGKPGANALQFDPAAATWNPIIDTGTAMAPQDLPFIINGSVTTDCAVPSNIPWLTVAPTTGTTAPAATTPVNVTFDSTGMVPG